MYELIIVGAGPAGTAAAVYAARKQIKTLIIAKEIGGQSTVSTDIHNWIGTPSISGTELAKSFKNHLDDYLDKGFLSAHTGTLVTDVKKIDTGFEIITQKGDLFQAKAILVVSGSQRRKLTVPGAEKFDNKGIVYCASCDGPLFAGQDLAVIGGGNAGFETAAQLLAYAKSVTLVHRSDTFKADKITVDKVLSHPNMRAITNAEIQEVVGDKFVAGLRYVDQINKQENTLPVTGIFVEIGQIPNVDFLGNLVSQDEYKRITIDPWTQRTSVEGIWAAGDATNVRFHQNNISAGDAVKALEDIYLWLQHKS